MTACLALYESKANARTVRLNFSKANSEGFGFRREIKKKTLGTNKKPNVTTTKVNDFLVVFYWENPN